MICIVLTQTHMNIIDWFYKFSIQYSSLFPLSLELFSILFFFVLTEFLVGRKIRFERNCILIFTLSSILAAIIFTIQRDISIISHLSIIYFIYSILYNFLKHVVFVSIDLNLYFICSSALFILVNASKYDDEYLVVFSDINKYVVENVFKFISLSFLIMMNYLSDIYIFKNFDIDIVLSFKLISFILTVIIKAISLIS